MMNGIDIESLAGFFPEFDNQHDNTKVLATSNGQNDAHSITAFESSHKFANLITVLLGNLNLLRRQPLNDKGQRQLARAENAIHELCNLFHHKQP